MDFRVYWVVVCFVVEWVVVMCVRFESGVFYLGYIDCIWKRGLRVCEVGELGFRVGYGGFARFSFLFLYGRGYRDFG